MTVMHPRRRSDDGEPLDPSVRSRMERHFGRQFEDVEVRTEATDATAMGAKAYTVGNLVSFAPGQYQPEHLAGQAVIAHDPRPRIRILPMFGLEETVPVLAAVLQRPGADAVLLAAAADALAAHPSPAADDALVEAAASGSQHVAEAAPATMADRPEPGGPFD